MGSIARDREDGEGKTSASSAGAWADHATALAGLGITSNYDLGFAREEDLVSAGIPLIKARQLLASVGVDTQGRPPAASTPQTQDVAMLAGPVPTIQAIADYGAARAERSAAAIITSSAVGGALLAFGGSMFVTVSGGTPALAAANIGLQKVVAAGVFPIGLSMIVLTSSDLLTSNFMFNTMPFLTRPNVYTDPAPLARSWGLSFTGNLIGSVAIAAFMSSYVLHVDPFASCAMGIATKKTSMGLVEVFSKAVLANWLVNVAIYMQMSAKSAGGKIACMWLPITTFVALGLEHSIANMFFIPLGIFCGADVSWASFFVDNLIPVTIGNGVGAVVFATYLPWLKEWKKP